MVVPYFGLVPGILSRTDMVFTTNRQFAEYYARILPITVLPCPAAADIDRSLILYALAGSVQVQAGRDAGLTVAQEVFADRSYQDDGSLTPRQQAGAMITDADQSVQQVMQMIEQGTVTSLS
uniref:Twitching motility protein PilT n=1 Tax=Steinernema glaseri TaxID=37863 RepID=A0A1I7YIT3_9BILA